MSFMESYTRLMGNAYGPSPYESSSTMGGAMMVGGSSGLGDYASQLSLGGDTYMTGSSNPFGGAFADFFKGFGRPSSFGSFMGGDAMSTYKSTVEGSWKLTPPNVLGMFGGGNGAGAANGAGGAGQAGGAGSTTNTEATTEAGETENKPIPEATITAAISALQEKGYSEDEAKAIVSKIEGAVSGDQAKFSSILAKVPAKATGENADTPNAEWVEQFGQWYARYIKGMSASEAEDYVHSTAFDAQSVFEYPSGSLTGMPYVTFNANPQSVQADVNGDGQMEETKKYTVKAGGDTGIAAGTEIYVVGTGNNRKFYQKIGDRYEEIPFRKSGSKYYVRVGETPNDNLTVHAAVRTETGPDNKIYDVYNVESGSAVGATATAISATTLYQLDGKWHTKDAADGSFDPLPEQPGSFENGRLSFGGEANYRLQGGFDTSMDARDYMQLLDDGASAVHDTSTQLDEETAAQREARVDTIQDGLEDIFGTNMQISVSEQGKTLELKYTAANAQAISDLLSASSNGKFTKFQELLSQLPAGTRVLLNGRPVISSDRASWISSEINKDIPRPLTINDAIDLRDATSIQEIKDKLRAEIDRQRISQGIRNAEKVSFSFVMLPDDEALNLDAPTLQTMMQDLAQETTFEGNGTATAAFAMYEENGTAPSGIIIVARENPGETDESLVSTMRGFFKEHYSSQVPNIDAVPITIVRVASAPVAVDGAQASGTPPVTSGGSSGGSSDSSGSGGSGTQAGAGQGGTGQEGSDQGSAVIPGAQPIAASPVVPSTSETWTVQQTKQNLQSLLGSAATVSIVDGDIHITDMETGLASSATKANILYRLNHMPEGTRVFLDGDELTGSKAQIAEKVLSGLQSSPEEPDTTDTHETNSEHADGVEETQSQLPEQPAQSEPISVNLDIPDTINDSQAFVDAVPDFAYNIYDQIDQLPEGMSHIKIRVNVDDTMKSEMNSLKGAIVGELLYYLKNSGVNSIELQFV